MGIPRVLTVDSQGKAVQKPIQELSKLREENFHKENFSVKNEGIFIEGFYSNTFEFSAVLKPGDSKRCGFRICASKENKSGIEIAYVDGNTVNVAGVKVPVELNSDGTVNIHGFFDKSVLEVFIKDGHKCVTRVVYPEPGNSEFSVFSEGGEIEVEELDIWGIESICPSVDLTYDCRVDFRDLRKLLEQWLRPALM
jgi:sucrose-6-phosphate hydrolase SacC (GH32 family)